MKSTKMSYEYIRKTFVVMNGEKSNDMKEGIVYISDQHHICHLCPCGCEEAVIIPFKHAGNDDGWDLSVIDHLVTVHPSILRTTGCKSHYFITNGEIVWA